MKSFLTIVSLFFVLVIVVFVGWHLDTPGRVERERSTWLGGGSGVEERVAVVGQINVAEAKEESAPDESSSVAVTVGKPTAIDIDGEQIYNVGCVACHGTGIAGAPKVGDVAAWSDRIETGLETLVEHAINGFQGSQGIMPANGGNPSLSAEEVHAAVEYMVAESQ